MAPHGKAWHCALPDVLKTPTAQIPNVPVHMVLHR